MKSFIVLAAFAVGATVPASAAWAPTMVDQEISALRSLGYEICEPRISQLPAEVEALGAAADAIPTPYGEVCEIRFASSLTTTDLNWVAWHEVCHLATINEIFSDPAHEQMEDPAHEHRLFSECLDYGPTERGGY